jgi:hypothetical protein
MELGAQESDIKVALMGEAGLDVICANVVVECANQEKLNIWKKIEQLRRNADIYKSKHKYEKLIELLVFKRNNDEPYVAIPAELFMFFMASSITLQGTTEFLKNKLDEKILDIGTAGSC